MLRRCWRWIIACGFVIADLVNHGHSASAAGVSLSWSEAARDLAQIN
jgi:hypothetical protein